MFVCADSTEDPARGIQRGGAHRPQAQRRHVRRRGHPVQGASPRGGKHNDMACGLGTSTALKCCHACKTSSGWDGDCSVRALLGGPYHKAGHIGDWHSRVSILDGWHDTAPTSMYRALASNSALRDDNLAQPCRGRGSWTSCRPRGSPSHRATAGPQTALPKQPLCPSWRLQMPKSLQIRCVVTLDKPAHTSAVDIAAQNSHGMLCACSVGPTPTSQYP